MRVLYFGTYERDYPRNAQVIACLRSAGVEVDEHHVSVWEGKRNKLALDPFQAARIAIAEVRLARAARPDADVIVVGYPGHPDVPAARRAARGRPVVFNPMVSLADTMVGDRGLVSANGVVARALRRLDRTAFRGADLVVADTTAHAAYFAEAYDLPPERLGVCFVGADDRLFTPGDAAQRGSDVLFVGKLIPLHGVETILSAAVLCPDISFHVIGSGQLDEVMTKLPLNVRHDPWVEYERLPTLYRSAACALGIFGASDKAARVIPNKAFQALATATPLITADTPAARELLADGHDALLVPRSDAEALATAVRRLVADAELRAQISAQGRTTYVEHASGSVLGQRWRALLEGVLQR